MPNKRNLRPHANSPKSSPVGAHEHIDLISTKHHPFRLTPQTLQTWYAKLYPTQVLSRYGIRHAQDIITFLKSPAGQVTKATLAAELATIAAQMEASKLAARLKQQHIKRLLMFLLLHYLAERRKRAEIRQQTAEEQAYQRLHEEPKKDEAREMIREIDLTYQAELDELHEHIEMDLREVYALDNLILTLQHCQLENERWFKKMDQALSGLIESTHPEQQLQRVALHIQEELNTLKAELAMDRQEIVKEAVEQKSTPPLASIEQHELKQLKLNLLQDTQSMLQQKLDPKQLNSQVSKIRSHYDDVRKTLSTQRKQADGQKGTLENNLHDLKLKHHGLEKERAAMLKLFDAGRSPGKAPKPEQHPQHTAQRKHFGG